MSLPQNPTTVGKVVLMGALLFCMTVIGANSSYAPIHKYNYDKEVSIDSARAESIIYMYKIQQQLKPYELARKPDKK